MEHKNGYFRPFIKDEKFYLEIFPAQEGGQKLDLKKVFSYLDDLGYAEYDIKGLNQAILSQRKTEVLIGEDMGNPIHEKVSITMSGDNMLVYCVFYPGIEEGKDISKEMFQDELTFKKVVYGIDEVFVDSLLKEHEFCTEYLIGKGTSPTLGKDAKIEYFFSTNRSLKPKHNEDGSVNYHELNIISKVEKEQLLARLIPAVPGEPGKDVLGNEIKAKDVQNLKLSYANNIRLSDDGTEIYSEVTGHASLVQGKVFVSAVYEVPADVDNSIGNIDYPGNVTIKGNVKSGFVVRAEGNIIVEGVVEGAELYAGGQIVVQRGIHGMNKGILQAEGNIVIKFIESAKVISGGYIETESIIHSQVSAKTEVNVSGGKGFIMGGVVRACNKVSARTLGSEMGSVTHIEVGVDPEKLEHYGELQQKLKEIYKEIEKIRPILINYSEKLNAGVTLAPDRIEFMKSKVMELKDLKREIVPIEQEINELRKEFMSAGRASVEAQNVVYPEVTIKISDLSMTTKNERKFCRFVKADGEIKVMNL